MSNFLLIYKRLWERSIKWRFLVIVTPACIFLSIGGFLYVPTNINNDSIDDMSNQQVQKVTKTVDPISPLTPPPPVFHSPILEKIKATLDNSLTIDLNWTAASNNFTGHYLIQKKGYLTFETIASTKMTHYNDTQIKTDKKYTYRVIAELNGAKKISGEEIIKTPKPFYTFNNFSVHYNEENLDNLSLQWSGSGKGIKYFYVKRKKKDQLTWENIRKIPNNYKTEFIDKSIDVTKSYEYKISAILIDDSLADEKITHFSSLLGKMNDLDIQLDKNNHIHISWQAPIQAKIDHYIIYRYQAPNGRIIKEKRLFMDKVNNTTWQDKKAKYNTEYIYGIQAIDINQRKGKISFSPSIIKHYQFSAINKIRCVNIKSGKMLIEWSLPNEDLSYSESFLRYEVRQNDNNNILCSTENIKENYCKIIVPKEDSQVEILTFNKNNMANKKSRASIKKYRCQLLN